jgi:hypothetical protein
MGELVTMLCFEGGLTASFAEQVAMARWIPAVMYMPLAWAYVGLDNCGICKTDAAALERVQLKVGRSILAAPKRVPNAVVLGELGWVTFQLNAMRAVLLEWGRIVLLKPEMTRDGEKERTVKAVVMEDVRRELHEGGGSSVARRVVHCARVFFSYAGEDTLWAVGKKEEWGERVGQCFKTLAQVEYERELKKCPTAEKYLKHKPLWGKAQWLVSTESVSRWGQRKAVYQFFGLRTSGHQLKSETCKHRMRQGDGTYRTERGCSKCRLCKAYRETPAKALFQCEHMESNREDFEKIVKSNVGKREWEKWRGWEPKREWKEILKWSSGAG